MEARTRDLAAATARKDAALNTLRAQIERLHASEKQLEGAVAESDAILTEKGLRASDRARLEDYRVTEEARLQEMRRDMELARTTVSVASSAEDTARAALELAISEEEALKRHRERIVAQERRAAEAASEEAQAEVHGGFRFVRSRGGGGSS